MTPGLRRWIIAACACIILAFANLLAHEVREMLAGLVESAGLLSSAYTDADAAHITLTNMSGQTRFACVRGTVQSKVGTAATLSVCSGEVKPYSTVALVAPYEVGKVRELCSGDPGQFGIRNIDWTKCTFNVDDLTPARR